MPDEYRVTIRLSPELYAQLEACGRYGHLPAARTEETARQERLF